MKNRKIVKRFWIILAVVLLIGAIYYFEFTPLGYRITVPLRGYVEIQDNVFVDKELAADSAMINGVVDEARDRVENFWGELESKPVIIIAGLDKAQQKMGGKHDTATVVFFKAFSYTIISDEDIDVDIIAHEMTHAELHSRLYAGKLPQKMVPVWFDEGLATQNDYREQYNDETWVEKTNNGVNVPDIHDYDDSSVFYSGTTEDRRYRYMISRHEVKLWLQDNGTKGLLELIEAIRGGQSFADVY